MQHLGPIAGIATRGHLIATAGYDNQVILWDGPSHRALARACHDHLVNHCAFSHDGRWLVSASSDYSARIWALPSLRLQAVLPGHGDDVDMAVFSPDDQRIATCALDRCVRIFDLHGHCLHEMHGHTGNVLSVAWASDGSQLVSSSVDGTLRTWDAETGQQVHVTDLQVRTDSIEIASDGTVYAGDDRGRIAIIRGSGLQLVLAHEAGVKKIALDARAGLLVSLSYDRSLAVWRVGDQGELEEQARSTLPATIWARAAAVQDDGRIVAGTFGATYAIFDPATSTWDTQGVAAGPAINAVLDVNAHTYSVGDAGVVHVDGQQAADMGSLCNFLVASGTRVFTGGQLGQLFDALTGEVLYEHHSPLNVGAAFERQGQAHLAIGSYTGEILVFSVEADGQVKLVTSLSVYENAIKGLSYSDGHLFSVCASTDIGWHHVADWSLLKRVNQAHERIANACCAVGGGQFASVSRDRSLRLWRPNEVTRFPSPHPNSIKCLAVNDAQTALLTGSYGGTVALFDLVNRRWGELHRPTASGISSITWDRTHQRFLAASYDGQLYPVPA